MTVSELLCVLWHIVPLSFSKTYSHALTVYTQAWITINPCSGEGVYGVSAVPGLMLRCKLLFLWSHLRFSEPKGLPLLIKAIKYTLVLAGVRGFENRSPDDIMCCNAQSATLSPAPSYWVWRAPACWPCASQALEGAPGPRGMASRSGLQQRGCWWCKYIKLHCLTDSGLAGKGFRPPAPKMQGSAVGDKGVRFSHAACPASSGVNIYSHRSTRAHSLEQRCLDKQPLFLQVPREEGMTSWKWSLPFFCFSPPSALSSPLMLLW